ncbi:unnamed protein product [Mytilus edulis]|uniref:BTB domain-containing protein n=1 Tax=Mytilus edulis TaxID=6550 RepID=A0A8S3SX89_MYTED|nr:unnamed protein product [Mytilus edulis]
METDSEDIEISGSIPTRKVTANVNEATQIDINRLVEKNEEIEICFMTTINRDDYKKNDSTGWREIKIGSNKSVFIKLEGTFLLPIDTMSTRLSRIWATDEFADIQFTFGRGVDGRSLPGHKILLSIRSNVFKAMFYGPMAEKVDVVDITDIEYDCFRTMLRDVYTDDIIITEENSIDLLKAAHKYEFEGLLSKCQNYLYRETNIDNSCSIYSWGRHLGLSSLTEKTLDFIVDSADDVLKTEGFLKLSNDDLHSLLSREDICAFEEEIITAAIKWARNKCKQDMIETNGQTMRQALGPVIYTLRIPLLSLKRYSDIVVKSMILSEEEELSLYKYFTMSKKRLADLCGFDKSSRNRLSLFVKAEDILKKRKVENIDDIIKATRFLQTSKSTIFVDTYTNKYQKQYNYQRTDYSQKISFFSPKSFFINAITISFPFLSEKNKPVPEEIQISGSVPTRKIRIPVNETKLFDMNRYVIENEEIEIYFTSFSKFDKQFKENESSGWREVKIGSNKSVFVKVEGSYSIVSAIDISAAKIK